MKEKVVDKILNILFESMDPWGLMGALDKKRKSPKPKPPRTCVKASDSNKRLVEENLDKPYKWFQSQPGFRMSSRWLGEYKREFKRFKREENGE